MADDSVQVINHHQASLEIRDRTNSKGAVTGQRSYMTIEVHSEPITVMLDEGAVAKKAAEMLAQRIREQTQQIAEQVKPATAKARRVVERAFAKGKPWALKQFAGGKTGVTPPMGGDRAFNHSGRLAESIVARFISSTKEWAINYAANRWNPQQWGGTGRMQAAFAKWVSLVPVLQDASSDLGIRKAIEETFDEVLQKNKMDTAWRAAKMRGDAVVKLLQLAARVV